MKQINIFQVIKNRSKILLDNNTFLYLYPNCIDSIVNSISKSSFKYKITICDFNSDDYPLKEWLPKKLQNKVDYEIISISEKFFDKGLALNLSRSIFKNNDFIFFLDVDNIININLIERLELRYSNHFNAVGFLSPKYIEPDGTVHKKIDSVGNLWIRHSDLIQLPKWIDMKCWGGEDTIFLYHCLKSNLRIFRETDLDLYHQWHPQQLRNKYYQGGKPPSDKYSEAIKQFYKNGILPDIKE